MNGPYSDACLRDVLNASSFILPLLKSYNSPNSAANSVPNSALILPLILPELLTYPAVRPPGCCLYERPLFRRGFARGAELLFFYSAALYIL